MIGAEQDDKVDQLLHDAEHAESGSVFASRMNDLPAATRLREKYEQMLKEANDLDPQHESSAWAEHAEWENRRWPEAQGT